MTSQAEARRIGGEFELHAMEFELATAGAPLPHFGMGHEVWVDSGRSALAVIARQLATLRPHATVWLPAYGCESLLAPFTSNGLALRFYASGDCLECIEATPTAGDALLFIHYFGRLHREALRRAAQWRGASVLLIEDCVQAPLTEGAGVTGDYVLNSWRKVLAQPDGALVGARSALDISLGAADETFVSMRTAGKLLRGAGAHASSFLPLLDESEARLDGNRPREMSWLSRCLLSATDLHDVARRRIVNERTLRKALAGLPMQAGVAPLQPELHPGEVPLGFAVTVDGNRRDALRQHLATHHIFCPIHWDLSHVPPGFDAERALSSRILTLPVDQRYDENDMRRIADVIATFYGEPS